MKPFVYRIQLLLFLLILFSVSGYWMMQKDNLPKVSAIEWRELNQFPKMDFFEVKRTGSLIVKGRFSEAKTYFFDQFLDHSFQNSFTAACSDQFPLRIGLIRTARGVDRLMISATYKFLPDQAIPLDAKTDFFISRDQSTVFEGIPQFDAETRERLDQRIANLAELAAEHPQQNFYVFYFEKLAYSKFDPRLPAFKELDGGRSFTYFEEHLPGTVTLGKMELTSLEDYNQNFYHTDLPTSRFTLGAR